MPNRIENRRIEDFVITNYHLSGQHVISLVNRIQSGESCHNLGTVYAKETEGKLYVNDGNHFIRACQIVGLEWILVEIYV